MHGCARTTADANPPLCAPGGHGVGMAVGQLALLRHGLVEAVLDYLDYVCAPALTGIGLNSLLSFDARVETINQCLVTLTEFCQGPCKENQVRRASVVRPGRGDAAMIRALRLVIKMPVLNADGRLFRAKVVPGAVVRRAARGGHLRRPLV